MLSAFCGVAFFLGAFITNYFKSKKIDALTLEAQGAQSRFYELQNLTKKQLGANEQVIKDLQVENSKNIDALALHSGVPTINLKEIKAVKAKNASLENELKSLKTRIKELKVEKAVHKVDKKYPMQLYGMDDEKSLKSTKKAIKLKEDKLTTKKPKSKIVLSDTGNTPKIPKSKKTSKDSESKLSSKPGKKKKKTKTKKRKSKKALALVRSSKKSKKKKKTKTKKKKKK